MIYHSSVIIIGNCISNDIDCSVLIKILYRLYRYFQCSRNLFQQRGINRFLLLQQGYFLLVPVVAQFYGQRILLYAQHFSKAFYVAALVYGTAGVVIVCHRKIQILLAEKK